MDGVHDKLTVPPSSRVTDENDLVRVRTIGIKCYYKSNSKQLIGEKWVLPFKSRLV